MGKLDKIISLRRDKVWLSDPGKPPIPLGGVGTGLESSDAVNYGQVVKNSGNESVAGIKSFTDTTQATTSTAASLKLAGGVGVAKNANIAGILVTAQAVITNRTGVAINTTGAGTLTVVTSGVVAGLITSTSLAGVTVTLDSVANMVTAFATAGVTLAAGSMIEFLVDNSGGSSTVTVAVDSGATLAVTTPAITGGATLTVSTANVVGKFGIYLTSTTAGKLLRLY